MLFNIYFSPTGGTKRAADIIAKNLNGEYIDVDLCRDIEAMKLGADDVCLISVPSYGGRVPAAAIERLQKISVSGTRAILNCVYGNRHWDDTLTELQDALEDIGFVCIAAIASVAEHSIFRQFGAGRPDAEDELQLIDFVKQIQKKLDNNEIMDSELTGSHNTYKEFNGISIKPEGNENCVSCGTCAKKCPVNAISFENLKTTDQEKCICCMRCVSICPVNARALNDEFLKNMEEKMAPVLSGRKENYLYL